MEEQGMDRRCPRLRSRLLRSDSWFQCLCFCALLIVFSAPYLFAAPGDPGVEAGPEVRLEYLPENPVVNHIWTVTILADHPRPAEVQINPPVLPDSLVLTQIRTVGRRTSADGRRWTAVEFLFVPQRAEPLSLGPFEVLIPDRRIMTGELAVRVFEDRENPSAYHPKLFWEGQPSRLRVGEAGELALRVQDWNPGQTLTLPRFQTTVPMEALVEDLPLTERDRNLGRVLKLKIIPLAEGHLTLGPFTLQLGALSLDVPAITLTLLPAPAEQAAGSEKPPETPVPSALADRGGEAASLFAALPWALPQKTPTLFREGAEAAVEQARLLWEEGRYTEALGVLRGGERDLMGGHSIVPLRQAAEEMLGIQFTIEEKWRPRNLLLGVSLGSLGLFFITIPLALVFRYRRKNGVTSRPASGYKIILPALIAVFLCVFIWALFVYTRPGGALRQDRAVLRSCAAYRVPDSRGAVSAYWGEGQPVILHSVKDAWVYAEAPGGEAGWVRRDNAVFY